MKKKVLSETKPRLKSMLICVLFLVKKKDIAIEKMLKFDSIMNENYNEYKDKISSRLSPIIIVTFDFYGGTYHLIKKDGMKVSHPVPPIYACAKSLAHIPLGIYSIMGSYLKQKQYECDEWQEKLKKYLESLLNSQNTIHEIGFTKEELETFLDILSSSINFIKSIINKGYMTCEDFNEYSTPIKPNIRRCMKFASIAQTSSFIKVLKDWKEELKEEWTKVYTVILTTWPITNENAHYYIIKSMMDPNYVDERIIIAPVTSWDKDMMINIGKDILARVIMDRLVSRLIFKDKFETYEDNRIINCLSSPTDIMGEYTEKYSEEFSKID